MPTDLHHPPNSPSLVHLRFHLQQTRRRSSQVGHPNCFAIDAAAIGKFAVQVVLVDFAVTAQPQLAENGPLRLNVAALEFAELFETHLVSKLLLETTSPPSTCQLDC